MPMTKRNENYYELLNIAQNATENDIEEAFDRAKTLYGDDSPALYSLYSSKEREALWRKLVEAYKTLKDPSKRSFYDRDLANNAWSGDKTESLDTFDEDPIMGGDVINFDSSFNRATILKTPVVMDDLDPLVTEQYRILYTKLEQIRINSSLKIFAVTSATKGEGKTLTTMNLACLISREFRKRVIIVECDLKKTTLSSDFFDESFHGLGLVNVLKGETPLINAIAQISDNNLLYLLPAGDCVRNSMELLDSNSLLKIFDELRNEFDYVILDCPPIVPLADMNVLSKAADGLLLVVRAGKTPRGIVVKAVKSLAYGNVLGIVLNGADKSVGKYY